ncbi:polygalacturonase inhibitor-like [Rutidosis leptorrhynchoides]|uniref:polygalacturonase inhibitor-like n=1 Tax=Rutidosis leptorrhynchoides TaxID=125765 RepID=UPI003A99F6C1
MSNNTYTSPNLVLLSFILIFSPALLPITYCHERCHPSDKRALLEIKKSANVPNWNPRTDCCESWPGVVCDDATNRVTTLSSVVVDDLDGQISLSIGNLLYLKRLSYVTLPRLIGPLPPTIAKLENLEVLEIRATGLSGPLPDIFGSMKMLTILDLSDNKFSGSIPSSTPHAPNIGFVDLRSNKLHGQIPKQFGEFKSKGVIHLYLSSNNLSGNLPATLANSNFDTIILSRNMLEGDASMLFGTNKSIGFVDLSWNKFEFNLPNVRIPRNLSFLDLSHNMITGEIPHVWIQSNLSYLDVSYNKLCIFICNIA